MGNKTEIIFTGTGSGKTSLKRHHTSLLLKSDLLILIDTGDGVSHALLKSKIDFSLIDVIVITHFHPDHLSGISSLLNQMKMNGRERDLRIYVHENLKEVLINYITANYIFSERLGFPVKFSSFNNENEIVLGDNISFYAKENSHLKKLQGRGEYDDKLLKSFSLLFNIYGDKILYSGDIGSKDDLFLFKNEKINILISEITHIKMNNLPDIFHLLNPQKIFIVHIDDEIESELTMWHQALDVSKREVFVITYDGQKVSVEPEDLERR